jgi:DNA gyrase subunit A
VTENGYGKRTGIDEYRVQSRGGVGIINIQTTARNGSVVGIAYVENEDELMLITQQGKVLRMDTKDIRTIGRATQGVRLIEIDSQDLVVSLARLGEVSADEDSGDNGTETASDTRES